MKMQTNKISEVKSFVITTFIVSVVISVVSIQFFFTQDYTKLLNQVERTLISFSQEKEKLVADFLANQKEPLSFNESQNLTNTIYIDSNGEEIPMDDLRKLLYVEQQKPMRLNAYLVNDKGALLTAQKEFDLSTDRTTTKIIRNELLSQCLSGNNNQENFYIGVDEGNRSVYGTYQKVSSKLPLCLFSETEKVTNIDIPAQEILRRYIFWGMLFILTITFLSSYLSSFSSRFSVEEMLLFILCGVAGFSYCFIVSLVTRGVNYFSFDAHFLEWGMATLSFSLLTIVMPLKKGRGLRTGSLLLGSYFLLTIFFDEYRQAYALASEWRNLILVLLRGLSISGFLFIFFDFKKNLKL